MSVYQVLHLSPQALQANPAQGYPLAGQVIFTQVSLANSVAKRLLGLLPKQGLSPQQGLWITPCNSIHSVGMRFEFDAAFVGQQGQVLHIIEAMRSFKLSSLVGGAVAVLEVPAHSLAANGVTLGSRLLLL